MATIIFNPFTGTLDFAGGGPAANVGTYSYIPGIAVGDAVYLSGSGQVALADADGPGTQPVVGVVASIVGLACVVQYSGELAGFVGLVPRAVYYLSTTGVSGSTITLVAPEVPPEVPPVIVQQVGIAKTASVLVVNVDQDYTELT